MSNIDDAAKAVDELNSALEQGQEHIPREDIELAVVDSEYRQPWDRQDKESTANYAMFLDYRDQGPGRTVKAAGVKFQFDGVEADWNRQTYYTSSKNNWKARALAWDSDQERQYQLARSQAIRDMVVRHEDQVKTAIDSLMVPIEALSIAIRNDPDFMNKLSKADAKKLIQMSNQSARTIPALMSAERLARGMPTEIVGGTIDHRHTVEMERDQIGEILEVLAGTGVLDVGGQGFGTSEIIEAEVVDVHPVPPDDYSVSGDDG